MIVYKVIRTDSTDFRFTKDLEMIKFELETDIHKYPERYSKYGYGLVLSCVKFCKKLKKPRISDIYRFGQYEIRPIKMDEAKYDSLEEFTGWKYVKSKKGLY